MIIDTSAWIEFSRGAGGVADAVQSALDTGAALTADVVRLELLAGADPRSELALRRLLATCGFVDQIARADVDAAAALFQRCRRAGETLRSPNDCLIAAIAIRTEVSVLHRDRDFDILARHTTLTATRG